MRVSSPALRTRLTRRRHPSEDYRRISADSAAQTRDRVARTFVSRVDCDEGKHMGELAQELQNFDKAFRASGLVLATTPARVCTKTGAKHLSRASLCRTTGEPDEQFYKWQLVSALVASGLVPADCIGCEMPVPRGSKGSTPLFIDVVIFASSDWVTVYDAITRGDPTVTFDDLYRLVVGCGEVKDESEGRPRGNLPKTTATCAQQRESRLWDWLLLQRRTLGACVTHYRLGRSDNWQARCNQAECIRE